MLTPTRAAAIALLCAWLLPAPAAADGFPPPQGRVNDFAGVLDEATEAALRGMVDAVERDVQAEVAVVTVASLDGRTVEDYARGLFEAWGIGKKGADNGVLVLVCPPERRMRIEVGYGLEAVLPDGLAGFIIRQQFTPAFREGDYGRGLTDGVKRVTEIVRANRPMTAEELRQMEEAEAAAARPPRWLMTPFFGLFMAFGAAALGAGLRMKSGFALLFGGLFGGIPSVMALIPFFNAALWLLLPLSVVMLGLGYGLIGPRLMARAAVPDTAGSRPGGRRSRSSGASAASSGWSRSSSDSDSWSSGSSSSSSSSSSGSSFGGGRSGGGGASGSW